MFKEISPFEMQGNPFGMIGKEWFLLTAGTAERYNTMTAAWGGLGYLWNQPVATVFVRPQRYTYEFTEKDDTFTLAFFGEGEYRKELALLGSKSGRDGDKVAEAGLTPIALAGAPAFEQARLVIVCKKLYRQEMLGECFVDKATADAHYPEKDFHTIYVGGVEKVFVKE